MKIFLAVLILVASSGCALAAEPLKEKEANLSALRMELAAVKNKIDAEQQRYNAAKSEMDRAELVARYLFPELRQREAGLNKKIAEAEAAVEKTKKDGRPLPAPIK